MRYRFMAVVALIAATSVTSLAVPSATAETAAPAASISSPEIPASPASEWVDSAQWVPGGPPGQETLSIMPTLLARASGTLATDAVMTDAVQMAGLHPWNSAVYASLKEQLECHLYLAVKVPYNLDTWRPSVPWLTELADLCNPNP